LNLFSTHYWICSFFISCQLACLNLSIELLSFARHDREMNLIKSHASNLGHNKTKPNARLFVVDKRQHANISPRNNYLPIITSSGRSALHAHTVSFDKDINLFCVAHLIIMQMWLQSIPLRRGSSLESHKLHTITHITQLYELTPWTCFCKLAFCSD
jgi:hypothetical protein